MGLLDGRVAIVTGAGRGIGRGIALWLAREGASVVVNDLGTEVDGTGKDVSVAEGVVKEIEQLGGAATSDAHSVADFAEAEAIVRGALDSFGTVDILVNNAGILRDRTLLKMTEEEWDPVIAVHLKGTFNCGRHAAPIMKEKGYGRIINITSSAGLRGNFGQSNYGAAKAGIAGLTRVWALELGKYGVTVNAFAPAAYTRMTTGLLLDEGEEPPPELDPELNGPLVAYLASERAAHVNGQIFGRRGYGYTIFQQPRPIATMYRPGGWTPTEIAEHFDTSLGQYLQPIGMADVIPPKAGREKA